MDNGRDNEIVNIEAERILTNFTNKSDNPGYISRKFILKYFWNIASWVKKLDHCRHRDYIVGRFLYNGRSERESKLIYVYRTGFRI